MEKRIPISMMRRTAITRALLLLPLLFLPLISANAQNITQREHIQLLLWADIDAYPELAQAEKEAHPDDTVFSYPIRRVKELAPYLITGMVYGWNFVYTPSDRLRHVAEYLEVTEIHPLGEDRKRIEYRTPWIENNRIYVWIEYYRTPAMMQLLQHWESVVHPHAMGSGSGKLIDGFTGIRTACEEAVKNAVREHFRGLEKNKPKEINGKVLLRGVPRLTVVSGRYAVELDFFIETGTIIKYAQF